MKTAKKNVEALQNESQKEGQEETAHLVVKARQGIKRDSGEQAVTLVCYRCGESTTYQVGVDSKLQNIIIARHGGTLPEHDE